MGYSPRAVSAPSPALTVSPPADPSGRALLAASGHTLIAALSYLVARRAMTEIPPLPLAWARIAGSGLAFGLLLVALRQPLWPPPGRRWTYLAVGAVGLPLNQGLFLAGLANTEVTHAALLYALTPAVVLLLSRIVQGERLTLARGLGVGLAFLGAGAVLAEGGVEGGVRGGDLLVGLGVLCWAAYTLAIRRLAPADGALASTGWAFVLGAGLTVLLYPLAVPDPGVFAAASPAALGGLLWLLLGSSFAGYLLWTYALRRLAAARVAVFTNLQPVVASALAWALLGEQVSAAEALGGALVLAGMVVVQRS